MKKCVAAHWQSFKKTNQIKEKKTFFPLFIFIRKVVEQEKLFFLFNFFHKTFTREQIQVS